MSILIGLIRALLPKLQSQTERHEAYLSEAADICDLERRMREVDAWSEAGTGGVAQASVLP